MNQWSALCEHNAHTHTHTRTHMDTYTYAHCVLSHYVLPLCVESNYCDEWSIGRIFRKMSRTHTHTHPHTHVYKNTCIYTYICTHMYTYVHTHKYICIHTIALASSGRQNSPVDLEMNFSIFRKNLQVPKSWGQTSSTCRFWRISAVD